jgi:hypothetical protein
MFKGFGHVHVHHWIPPICAVLDRYRWPYLVQSEAEFFSTTFKVTKLWSHLRIREVPVLNSSASRGKQSYTRNGVRVGVNSPLPLK